MMNEVDGMKQEDYSKDWVMPTDWFQILTEICILMHPSVILNIRGFLAVNS